MNIDQPRLARQVRLGLAAAAIVLMDLALAVLGLFGPLFFVAVGIAVFQLYLAFRRREMATALRYANVVGALWVLGFIGYVLIRSWTGNPL
jgi:hypothetical protein